MKTDKTAKTSYATKTAAFIHGQLSTAGRVIAARVAAPASKTTDNSNGAKTVIRSEYTALPTESKEDKSAVALKRQLESLAKLGVNVQAILAEISAAAE